MVEMDGHAIVDYITCHEEERNKDHHILVMKKMQRLWP